MGLSGLDGRRWERLLAHIACTLALAGALLAAGAWASGFDLGLLERLGVVDETAPAMGEGEPEQSCVFFLNARLHPDDAERAGWLALLSGEEASAVMGDATCLTLAGDVAAKEQALLLAAGLEGGRLTVKVDDAMLAVSKAEAGRFDILVMSEAMADALDVSALEGSAHVEVVRP